MGKKNPHLGSNRRDQHVVENFEAESQKFGSAEECFFHRLEGVDSAGSHPIQKSFFRF